MRPMETSKIPVQRVTVTITMDCREDLPARLLEWMRDELEDHAKHAFGGDYTPQSVAPPPPVRNVRTRSPR